MEANRKKQCSQQRLKLPLVLQGTSPKPQMRRKEEKVGLKRWRGKEFLGRFKTDWANKGLGPRFGRVGLYSSPLFSFPHISYSLSLCAPPSPNSSPSSRLLTPPLPGFAVVVLSDLVSPTRHCRPPLSQNRPPLPNLEVPKSW
ncbi:hypothetical protein Droror1_Dr00025543 [Drosera rotundifolia]